MYSLTAEEPCVLAIRLIGASLSEPHIDEFAVEFLYIYIIYIYIYICLVRRAVSHFRLLFCAFLRHSLIQKQFTNYSYSTQREADLPTHPHFAGVTRIL